MRCWVVERMKTILCGSSSNCKFTAQGLSEHARAHLQLYCYCLVSTEEDSHIYEHGHASNDSQIVQLCKCKSDLPSLQGTCIHMPLCSIWTF